MKKGTLLPVLFQIILDFFTYAIRNIHEPGPSVSLLPHSQLYQCCDQWCPLHQSMRCLSENHIRTLVPTVLNREKRGPIANVAWSLEPLMSRKLETLLSAFLENAFHTDNSLMQLLKNKSCRTSKRKVPLRIPTSGMEHKHQENISEDNYILIQDPSKMRCYMVTGTVKHN